MSFFDPIIPLIPQLTSNIAPQLLPTIYSGSNHSLKPNISYQNQLYQNNEYDHNVNSNFQINNNAVNTSAVPNTNNVTNNTTANHQSSKPEQNSINQKNIQNNSLYYTADNSKVINQVLQFSFNNNANNTNMPYFSPLAEYTVNNINPATHLPISNTTNTNIPYYSPIPNYSKSNKKAMNSNNLKINSSIPTHSNNNNTIKNSNAYYSPFSNENTKNIKHISNTKNIQNVALPPVPPTSVLPTPQQTNNSNRVLDSIDSILQRQTQYTCFPYRNNFEYLSPSIFDTSNTNQKASNSIHYGNSIKQTSNLATSNVDEVIADIVKGNSSKTKPFPVAIGSEIKKQKKMTQLSFKNTELDNKNKLFNDLKEKEVEKKYLSEINELVKNNSTTTSNDPENKFDISSTLSKSILSAATLSSNLSYSIINDNVSAKQNFNTAMSLGMNNGYTDKETMSLNSSQSVKLINKSNTEKLNKHQKVNSNNSKSRKVKNENKLENSVSLSSVNKNKKKNQHYTKTVPAMGDTNSPVPKSKKAALYEANQQKQSQSYNLKMNEKRDNVMTLLSNTNKVEVSDNEILLQNNTKNNSNFTIRSSKLKDNTQQQQQQFNKKINNSYQVAESTNNNTNSRNNSPSNISHAHCNMRKALTERNDKVAWQSYKEIADSNNLKDLSHTDFSRILRILRNERGPVRSPNNLNEMVQIIEHIKEAGFQPNHGDFTTMIAAFGRSHQLVKALTYFEEMKQANLEPDIFTYNTLIDVYGKNKELHSAVKIFNEMKEKKLKPTLATYNILISAHGLNEDPKGAKHWFDCVMKDPSISANEITYSNIMDAYARVGDVKNTLKYLNEMKSHKINPSLGHYNSLVLVYTKVGDIEKATEKLNEMKEKGMEPSPHIYSLLMNAYGENDNISGAFKILYNHHKRPGRSMYHTMIQLYGKKGDLLNAWQTLSQMIQQRITPTPLTWRILASCHGDKPCINFWSQQVNIVPTAAMYNHFLEYYSKQPNIKAVTFLFDEMKAQNFAPTIETYNSILHAYSILGDSEAVFNVYSDLEKAKLEPNLYTYNILLKVYAKIGDSQSAMKLFENEILPKEHHGVIPDAFTYNALLESFNEKFDQSAFKYLDDMKAKGLAPVPHRDMAIMKAIHASNFNLKL